MLPLVRRVFDRDQQKGGSLVDLNGNSFAHACHALIKHAAGENIAIQEALQRKIESLRDELAGPSPSPLERILAERVSSSTWFDANEMDRRFADQGGLSFKDADHRESRRDRAHKRFLSACKFLATVAQGSGCRVSRSTLPTSK